MNNFRDVRQKKKQTLAAVAVRAHSAIGTLILIEKYGHEPRPDTKARLAKALDVDVRTIWPGTAA